MRVVKNPEERKAEILSAAIRVFARKGYDKTSISDIAKEIGISQGLCYRYYTSKEEIYDAALDEYADYIARENLRQYDLRGKTLKEMIQEMSGHVDDYVEVEQEQRELFELFHKGDNKRLHDQLFVRVAKKMVPILTQFFVEAKERGEITVSDPQTVAYFFVYGQMGMLMDPDINETDCTKRIQDFMIESLNL